MFHKSTFLILIPIIFFASVNSLSQTIDHSAYVGSFNVKIGDYREYRQISLQKDNNPDQFVFNFKLDNGSWAVFNTSNNLIYKYTVVKINQTNGQKHIYLQVSFTTNYQILSTNVSAGDISQLSQSLKLNHYGTLHSKFFDSNGTVFLYPSFPNKTMAKYYFSNYTNGTDIIDIKGNDLTIIQKSSDYPYEVSTIRINWKTGWLQDISINGNLEIKIVNPSFDNSLTSPLILITIGSSIVIISTLVILAIKYRRFKTLNPGTKKNISFIDYTKGLLKPPKNRNEHPKIIDIDKSLHTLEEIIDENKES